MIYRIPYGFRFKTTDILTAHQQLCDLREGVHRLMRAHTRRIFADNIIPKIDEDTIKGKLQTPLSKYASIFYDDLRNRQKTIIARQTRDVEVDFDCSVTLYPLDENIYATIYTEHSDWAKYILRKIPHDDFSSRVPEDAIKEDERREEIWERAFGGRTRFAKSTRGLEFKFNPPDNYFPTMREIIAVAPTFEKRLLKQARNQVLDEKWTEIYNGLDENERAGAHFHVMRAHTFSISDEAKPLVEEKIKAIRPVLLHFEDHSDKLEYK